MSRRAFDYAGRPVTASTGATPLVTSATYLPFGPAAEIRYGNGTTETSSFDSRYRIETNALSGPAGAIASYDYDHDDAGNITAIRDLLDPGYDRGFGYDDINRLTTANSGAKLWVPARTSTTSWGTCSPSPSAHIARRHSRTPERRRSSGRSSRTARRHPCRMTPPAMRPSWDQ